MGGWVGTICVCTSTRVLEGYRNDDSLSCGEQSSVNSTVRFSLFSYFYQGSLFPGPQNSQNCIALQIYG